MGPRHCQSKVATPARLRVRARWRMDGTAEKSRFSGPSSRLVNWVIATLHQEGPPRRETHFCSVQPRLNLNNRVTKEVDPVAAFLGK